jgi:hypothetical protein
MGAPCWPALAPNDRIARRDARLNEKIIHAVGVVF